MEVQHKTHIFPDTEQPTVIVLSLLLKLQSYSWSEVSISLL